MCSSEGNADGGALVSGSEKNKDVPLEPEPCSGHTYPMWQS